MVGRVTGADNTTGSVADGGREATKDLRVNAVESTESTLHGCQTSGLCCRRRMPICK